MIGKFEVHITTGDVELNLTTLCKRFSLPGIIQHYTALECDKGMRGDTIVLKKMDDDSLRLFEFIPISKYKLNQFYHVLFKLNFLSLLKDVFLEIIHLIIGYLF